MKGLFHRLVYSEYVEGSRSLRMLRCGEMSAHFM